MKALEDETDPLAAHARLFLRRERSHVPSFQSIGTGIRPIEQAEQLEQLRAMWHGERIAVLITERAPEAGVDTPADLARVQALFRPSSK